MLYTMGICFGWLAQLVEHLVYTEGVKGSSPLLPTKTSKSGGVAQLVRAIACHAIGRGFESLHSRHFVSFLVVNIHKIVLYVHFNIPKKLLYRFYAF